MANIRIPTAALGQYNGNPNSITYGKTAIINNEAGTPVDFSAWFELEVRIEDTSANANGDSAGNKISLVTPNVVGNADGTVSLIFPGDEVNALARFGQHVLSLLGKPASGDTAQLVGLGSFNLQRTEV